MRAREVPNIVKRPARSYGELLCIGAAILSAEVCLGSVTAILIATGSDRGSEPRPVSEMREELTTLDAAVSRCSAHRKEMEALSQSRQKERAKLSAPVLVLEAIQIVLSDGAWLKAMEISGSQVTIKGEALSEHEVFETFERLRGVPFLNDVKVDSTRLIPTSERQTQEFTVRAIFVGEPLSEKIS